MIKGFTSKKNMKFQSIDALKPVENVLFEIDKAIKDKSRKLTDSPLSEVLAGAVGVGVGAGVGFAGLYFGGSVVGLSAPGITSGLAAAGSVVGGGMVSGIAVLATPAVVLGTLGVGVSSYMKNKKLQNAKELLYKDALKKQTALLKALKEETNQDKERIEYLTRLNTLLEAAIKDLKYDLEIAA